MTSEWQYEKLGDITTNLDAKRKPVREADRKHGPYPYYGASGIVDYVEDYLFDGEHLLIAEDGENLRTRQTPIAFRATGKFWVNNHAHIVVGNQRASTRYLEYAVQGTDISAYLTGAVMPKLTQGNLNRIEVPCPPRAVQDLIVAVLGNLDDRITLLRETNQTLEAIAQALFKSWFVDFDPVRAKAEGRLPDGIDEATAALFPDMFTESDLGLIPKGWQVKTMSEVLKPKNDRVRDLEVPEYSSTNTGLVPREKMYTKQLSSSSSKNKLIKRGDIVFGLSRQLLNFGQMNDALGSVSSAYKVYEVDSTSVLPALLGRLIRTRADYFFNAVSASSREGQSISSEALGVLKYCQPPIEVQQTLWKNIDVLVEAGDHKLIQAEQLELIRDTLLLPLISGQLRIADSEPELEKAMT